MRLPWISRRPSQRAATRRKRAAPLRVRRLERRRVLDAAITDLVFAPADLDGSTAVHDTNEGTEVTVTAVASGSGTLFYEWQVVKDATVVAQSFNQTLHFTPLDDGSYSVTVTVFDSLQSSASRTETVLVHNLRPVLVAAQDQLLDEGSLLDLSAIGAPPLALFIDEGILDTHTATVDWGDGSAIEAPTIIAANGSGVLGGTHTYADNSVYEVIVTVTDDDGGSDTQSFFVTVSNVAPTAALGNNGPVDEGSSATVTFTNQFDPSTTDTLTGFRYAYDLDNDSTFDVGDGTYANSVTSDTQMISAALLADGPGTRTVRAWIVDKDGAHTEYTTEITINNVAPELLNITIADGTIDEGETATITMTIDDPGALDVFEIEVDWQDSAPADTITGLGLVNASGTVGGTTYQWDAQARELTVSHLYPDDNPTVTSSDVYAVALTVRDDDLGVTGPYQVDITVSNVRPVLVVAPDQTVDEGELLDLSAIGAPPIGLFIDDGELDTHTATVDWGDGSALEIPAIFAANGSGALGAAHTYADNGVYTVTITVTDDDGGVDTQSFEVTVGNVAPTAVLSNNGPVDEGSSATVTFTNQFDPSTADTLAGFRYAYDLDNDGTFDAGDGTYAGSVASDTQLVSAALLVEGPGMHTVKGRIIDKDGGFTDYTTTIVINNVAPELVNIVVVDTSIDEGETATITMTVDDPGVLDVFEVDVNWQDGGGVDTITGLGAANTSGTVGDTTYEWDAQARQLTVSHLYQDDNPTATPSDLYQVALAVRDDDGGAGGPYQANVTVNNVRPVLVVAADQTANEGQLLDLTGIGAPLLGLFIDDGKLDTHTATVDWGDGSTVEVPTIIAADGSGALGATHTYADNGLYIVTVTIYDDDGGSHTQTFEVTVNNVAPTLGVTPSATTINEGQTVDFDAIFSDPGFDNPLDPGGATVESFRYFVDWGDGRDQLANNVVMDTNGMPGVPSSGTFDGSHTFADDGVYTVTVRMADDDMSGNFAAGVAGVDFVEKTFTVTVENLPPSLTGTTNVSVDEGTAFTLTGLGVGLEDHGFDNPLNPTTPSLGDPLRETFTSFTVNWGDGSAATAVSIDNVNDRTSGSPGVTTKALFTHAAHTYADDGVYTVTIRVADDNMSGDFANGIPGVDYVNLTFTITVENVVPTLTATANQTVNESEDLMLPVLATFTDPGFDNPNNPTTPAAGDRFNESFSYFLDWGDGREQIGSLAVADLNGAPGTPSSGSFGGTHNYADNGVYTVTIRLADDNMSGNFAAGVAGVDYVEQTFTVTVNNVGPAFTPQPNGDSFQGDEVNTDGITTIRVAYNDPGYDNPLNTLASNGGETVETFNHVVQWGDGTVDAIHQYTSGGAFTVTVTMTPAGGSPQQFTFQNFNSSNPVLTLVSSQQLNDPSVVAQVVTYTVDWGDGHVETFQLSLLNPGLPVASNGLTTLLTSSRNSGNATTLTTGTAEVLHRYLGPPDPLHPTADIVITLTVYDDDGAGVTDTIAIGNPGIQTVNVAIDTTPDVPRLDPTEQPMVAVFIADQNGGGQLLQVPDLRSGGGEVAATAERYLELRIVNPDGTESEGYRIKDEALADLRAFFKTLPDGKYRIYLIRTENQSERLVIEVDVRRGRVIDVSDDSEGTRDRPPTGEENATEAVPLDQNPNLEPVEPRQGELETRRQGEHVEIPGQDDGQVSLSPDLFVSLSASAAALAAQPWSRRVDDALAGADESAWRRLRRASRSGRTGRQARPATTPLLRTAAILDYNRT